MFSDGLEKELARLQKEREQIFAELNGFAKADNQQPSGGQNQEKDQTPALPDNTALADMQARQALLESELKAKDDSIKAYEAVLAAALKLEQLERDRDNELRQTNAMAEFAARETEGGHNHAGHGTDHLGALIIGGIAAAAIVKEAIEPLATIVEGGHRLAENATRHEAETQTKELEALHDQHKDGIDWLKENEVYQAMPAATQEAWLEHKLKEQAREEQSLLTEFEKRDPKAFELNKQERQEALEAQSQFRDECRTDVPMEIPMERREHSAERVQDPPSEPEIAQKPQWDAAERAEKLRCEFELKKLHEEQEKLKEGLIERLGKKVADGTIDMEAVRDKLEEQRKAFERQEQQKREEQRDRADRIELLYRGPPSERGL